MSEFDMKQFDESEECVKQLIDEYKMAESPGYLEWEREKPIMFN